MALLKEAAKLVVYSEPFRKVVRRDARVSSALIRMIRRVDPDRTNTGGTDDARYCYTAWLRHWSVAGLTSCPSTILEVGPGDSLGVGLAGMLCGANGLYGVDGYRYATPERTLGIFDSLVDLFRKREPIPSNTEFPESRPFVDTYDFPSTIRPSLAPERLAAIRACIESGMTGARHGDCFIKYAAPWKASDVPQGTVDFIYSQATMEHVPDIDAAYGAMAGWLAPGGRMAHQIDFRCHSTSLDWNGHWMYSTEEWQRIQDDKGYYWINRQPCSAHLEAIARHVTVCSVTKQRDTTGLRAPQFAPEWRRMSDDDAECYGVYVVAQKDAD